MKFELIGDLGVCKMLIESLILILSYLSLISVPHCLQVVDKLSIQLNGVVNEQGVLEKDLFNLSLTGELSRFWLEL